MLSVQGAVPHLNTCTLYAEIQNGILGKACLHHFEKWQSLSVFLFRKKKVKIFMQTGWSQDQVPHRWDLILTQACLQFYKSTASSVSQMKWAWVSAFGRSSPRTVYAWFCFCQMEAETQLVFLLLKSCKRQFGRPELLGMQGLNILVSICLLQFWLTERQMRGVLQIMKCLF